MNKNSQKIFDEKLQNEKPIQERAKDLVDLKRRYIDINSRVKENEKLKEERKHLTKLSVGNNDEEKFEKFIQKQYT